MKHTILIVFLFAVCPLFSSAQEIGPAENDTTPFYRLSLEELMNLEVTVASQTPMTNRESPGIVTVITQEEIKKSGANDLMEVLKLVSGFDFSVDVDGVVGIGMRGNWANEGKVLLLWDGIEMNEDLYSTLQFGGHYPIDRISRIEIIRGPGSAMYGGNAEYAVINIITANNTDFNGVSATVSNSMMSKTFGSRGVSVAAGKSLGKAHINLSTSFNQSNRSQENYTDITGKSYDMKDQSGLSDSQYRMDFFFKGLSVTGLYDNYNLEQRDGYNQIYLRSYNTEFNAGYISAKYELKGGKKLTITPGMRFKIQEPWSYKKNISDDLFTPFNTTINKKEYYINASYDPNEQVHLISGIEYYHQLAQQKFDTVFFSNGSSRFNIDNYAVFLQSILKLSPFNFIMGCRYDYNPIYGSSFVPRIGLTKVWEKFHLKTLYSSAFRTPSVENINASPDILPEKTLVAEFEAGCRLALHSYLTANVYNITTSNSIIYYYDENEEDKYKNEKSTGTRGLEIEYKWKSPGWYAAINYSYYTIAGHSAMSVYQAPGQSNKLLAFPSHKINLNSNVQLSHYINVNPSVSYNSTRYSISQEENGDIISKSLHPSFYANLSFNLENIFSKGFAIQVACLNMFNENIFYIQPYNGNHQPLPGTGREFKLKFTYSFSFNGNK